MKQNLLAKGKVISLIVLIVLGIASGWVYHYFAGNSSVAAPIMSQTELMGLQVSFIKQYGTQANISEVITPKIYEVAWTDGQGGKNVSMNVGGVWVLIANVPASPAPSTGGK